MQHMPSPPQTIAANADCGMDHRFDQPLRSPKSSTELQIPEKLKKSSTLHASIRRNIYLTKKVKTRAEDDGIFCSCNPTKTSARVCGGDCLCGMLLSCCTQTCKCGPSCLNKPFQQRPIRKMKLIETEKCGSGIVADEDINQGEFIIEYVGEVIDDKMCEERLWKMKHTGEKNFYLCEINRDTVIDATYKGNKSRYINHSCQPNTEMQKWIIDGETRIGIFAIRDITKGDELTYDYKFVQFGADQECHCGAAICRGKLGSKPPKELRKGNAYAGSRHLGYKKRECHPNCIGVLLRIWCPQAKRNYGGVIMDFDNLTKKHTILNEDGQLENLDLLKEEWDFL